MEEKARLDRVRRIHFNLKYLVTLCSILFTECHGAKFKHLKLSVHHHLCRESVLQSHSSDLDGKFRPVLIGQNITQGDI